MPVAGVWPSVRGHFTDKGLLGPRSHWRPQFCCKHKTPCWCASPATRPSFPLRLQLPTRWLTQNRGTKSARARGWHVRSHWLAASARTRPDLRISASARGCILDVRGARRIGRRPLARMTTMEERRRCTNNQRQEFKRSTRKTRTCIH